MLSHLLCCWKRVFAVTSAFSWQNSVGLCFLLYSKVRFTCYSRYLFTSHFYILVPYSEKDIFFWVLVLESLVGHQRTIQLQHLVSCWGIDLDYCDIEWFALEMNRDYSIAFEIAPKHCILNSLIDYEGYSISSKEFLPRVVDIMVI